MRKPILAILALILASVACGQYITPTPAVSPVFDTGTPPPPTREATVTAVASASIELETVTVTASQALHVRASRFGVVIGYLYNGDTVTLTNKCSHGWAEIEWQGARGWVNSDFLSDNTCKE
jgi:hypothetical protein